jgi:hypothetical protein
MKNEPDNKRDTPFSMSNGYGMITGIFKRDSK